MTDQELMIYAARAMGCVYSEEFGILFEEEYGNAVETDWNPLEDNLHAFRLALDLQINIQFLGLAVRCSKSGDNYFFVDEGVNNNDVGAATRRAILRVAARIGESKQLLH